LSGSAEEHCRPVKEMQSSWDSPGIVQFLFTRRAKTKPLGHKMPFGSILAVGHTERRNACGERVRRATGPRPSLKQEATPIYWPWYVTIPVVENPLGGPSNFDRLHPLETAGEDRNKKVVDSPTGTG